MNFLKLKTSLAALMLAGSLSATSAAELNVVGTGDGLAMLASIAEAFEKQHPDIDVLVPPSIGSGGGIAAVGNDTERMGRVARPLKDSEVSYGLVYIPIAKIPSAIMTHKSANVMSLTSDQLRDIYAGKVRSWGDVGGADIGL